MRFYRREDDSWELPPHARRIPPLRTGRTPERGTTSACAENTVRETGKCRNVWNYLRMRGEYNIRSRSGRSAGELPPHARRILVSDIDKGLLTGTTSACAENTTHGSGTVSGDRNYLRMRGEYEVRSAPAGLLRELPPHARRIRYETTQNAIPIGTTSACAENTWGLGCFVKREWNYLRMRGEYRNGLSIAFVYQELPPHARRIPV